MEKDITDTTKTSVFPNRFASKAEKSDKKYMLQYARAIWSEKVKNDSLYNGLSEIWKDNRRYAEGLQDIDKYKNQLNLLTGDLSWLNLDFSPVNRIAALVDNIEGKLMNQLYKVQCNPIDVMSRTKEDEDRDKMYAAMFLKKNASDLEPLTGVPMYPRNMRLPETDDEAELYFKMNYKQASAIAMEQAMSFVFMNNNFDTITRKKILRDLIVNKRAAIHRYYDENKNICIKYVDHVKVVTPYSSREDFSNIPYIAVLEDMTIGDIAESTNDFSDEQLEEIAKKYEGRNGNPMINDLVSSYEGYYNSQMGAVRPWHNFNIQVLKFYFLSICKENRVKTTKENGRIFWDKKDENYVPTKNNKESIVKNVQYLFEGSWIIGSEYVFNNKQSENIPRARENGAYSTKAELPILMIAPNIYDMQNKSLVERARPHEDQLNLINLKIQQHLIQAKPPGVSINKEALSDIMLGQGKEAAKPTDIFRMYSETGSIVYSDVRDDGEIINSKVIDYLPNGVGADFAVLVNAFREEMQKINDVIGYNSAVDGSSPDAEAVVGAAKMAIQATNNALRPLYHAHVQLIERASKGLAVMIQDSIKYNQDAFYRSIGTQATKTIEYGKDLAMHQFGIKIEMLPDDEEKMDLINMLQAAIDKETVYTSDVFEIRAQMKSDVKLAAQLLVLAENRKRRQMMQEEKAKVDYTTQQQTASGEATAAANADAEERMNASKAELLLLQANLEDRNAARNHNRVMEQIGLKNQGAKEVQETKNDGEMRHTAFETAITPKEEAVLA